MQIRDANALEEARRKSLHATWDEKVYQPLATQAFEHMNAPCRRVQHALAGSKSVGFLMPEEPFRLSASLEEDPLRGEILDHAWEEAFDREATELLRAGLSSPALRSAAAGGPTRRQAPPRARSRPVLEPTAWGQEEWRGTRYAHQVEQGPGARMGRRNGPGEIFLPDDADGIAAAGTKTRRVGPSTVVHGDTGLLRGDLATRGEAAQQWSRLGASSGAPGQDHYTYETGSRVTDLEFPVGKRLFAQWP
mmetsp:Transcript_33228/g.72429  ORF Transcript_33228/g.72429 Transcript_33228/m.72429 type:complete len:249 (-) Transcript_33228:66-812(-)